MLNLGTVPASTTIYIPFATYDGATGASETCSGLAVTDIEIYKNGSATQRASDAGYTLLDTDGIDFDGITGINGFSIDLSDNTDAGFYAVGSWYWVVVSSITADGQTVNFIAAVFRIGPAENVAGYQPVDIELIDGDGPAAANLNSACDNYSVTRGLSGTALPAAAADATGGLPISDAGGLDLDAIKTATDKLGYTGAGPYYVNAQVKAQDNIDFGALQKASLNAATPASVQNIPVDGTLDVNAKTITDAAIKSTTFSSGALDAAAASADLGTELATALLDLADGIESGIPLRKAFRAVLSALVGKVSGAGTAEITFRDAGDTKNRIVATVDEDGNRSAVTLTLT